jgi:hypothetical protein
MAGAYLAGSALVHLFAQGTQLQEYGLPGLAVGLSLVFLLLAQDPVRSHRH